MDLEAIQKEFWGDLQVDLYTANTAVYLANQRLENLISTNGRKAHRPILAHPRIGTYTPHSDIAFRAKKAQDNELVVQTFEYAADDIDDTETNQSPYALLQHSLMSIRKGLMNRFEQVYLSEIPNAFHSISNAPVSVATSNVLPVIREANARLGSFDVPMSTDMRAWVVGPNTAAILREVKAERETARLGDSTLENGVVGPWMGWTVVENNNLPWSATLKIATNPADGDTVTIAGVVFEFQDDLDDVTEGNVGVLRHSTTADTSRLNLLKAIQDSGTEGTDYTEMSPEQDFIIRRKRYIKGTDNTNADTLSLTGFGDIGVSETLTASGDGWSNQLQESVFMMRGAIDAVLQFQKLEIARKEKGFADLPKGLIGMDAHVFDDGAIAMVRLRVDASNFY